MVQPFRGVTPGTTTEAELRANQAWGQPVATPQPPQPEGRRRLVYKVQPWEQIAVVIEGGVVRTIDFVPPAVYLELDAFVNALKLGPLRPLATLPAGAEAGGPPEPGWRLLEPSEVYIVLFVEQVGGSQHVKWMRSYSPRRSTPVAPADPKVASVRPPTAPPEADAATSVSKPRSYYIAKQMARVTAGHLSGHPLDGEIARRTVEVFVSYLDSHKLYFMQSDVDRFHRRSVMLIDELREGDCRLGREIQDTFVERVRERMELVREFLALEHDFNAAETIPWGIGTRYASSDDQVRELWRKRVKYWLLTHRAAGADDLEARRRTMASFRRGLEECEQLSAEDAGNTLVDSVLRSFDPHSAYFPPAAASDQELRLRQELSGIGAALGIEDGYVKVRQVVANGPAARDGRLQAGDGILAVGEGEEGELVDVVGARLSDVVERIRGPRGTVVRLKVLPAGRFESSVYRITRDKVETSTVAGAILEAGILPDGRAVRVGYVYLPTFYADRQARAEGRDDYRSSTRDLGVILREFLGKDADVVVLDMRANTGGTTIEAIEMSGLFLGKSPVLQFKDRDGKVQVSSPQSDTIAWRGPLVVLTTKLSGGGTEIFAGAMADYRRGLIVGDPKTAGLGTSQNLFSVGAMLFRQPDPPDLGMLKLTQYKFYRPSGESTQLHGVVPHVVLPSLTAVRASSEESLPYALDRDRIAPVQFTPLSAPLDAKSLQTLKMRSEARRRDSAYFLRLAEAIEQETAKRERTELSLKEADFLAEIRGAVPEGDWPTIPGIPAVRVDPYLQEVLEIAADYVAQMQ